WRPGEAVTPGVSGRLQSGWRWAPGPAPDGPFVTSLPMIDPTSPVQRDDATLPPAGVGNPLPLWAIAVALYGAIYVAWIGYGTPAAPPLGRALVNAVFLPLAS